MNLKKCTASLMVGGFLLTGCSSATSNITQKDGKDIIASVKDKDIYADDTFAEIVKTTAGKEAYYAAVIEKLANTKFPVDEAMETDADLYIENLELSYKNNYGTEADAQLQAALASSGFSSLEALRANLISSYQQQRLVEQYVNDHYDEVFDDFYEQMSPRMMRVIKVNMANVEAPTEEEQAKLTKVQDALKAGTDFSTVASENSEDTTTKTISGNLGLISDKGSALTSTYGETVITRMMQLNEGEVSEAIKGTGGYYFLKCDSTNKDTIKEQIKNKGLLSPLLTYDTYLIYVAFDSYDIEYQDDETKQIISEYIETQLKAREDARKPADNNADTDSEQTDGGTENEENN